MKFGNLPKFGMTQHYFGNCSKTSCDNDFLMFQLKSTQMNYRLLVMLTIVLMEHVEGCHVIITVSLVQHGTVALWAGVSQKFA